MTEIQIEDLVIAENAKTEAQTVADILDTLAEFLKDDTNAAERAGMLKAMEIIRNNH